MKLGLHGLFAGLGILPLLVGALAACSSAEGEGASSSLSDRITIAASDATRAKLGVETWGVSKSDAGVTVVRGYDAAHAVVVRFEQGGGGRTTFRAGIMLSATKTTSKMSVEIGASARVRENSFTENPAAREAVAQMARDLASQPASGTKLTTASVTSGLRPLDENGGASLTNGDGGTSVGGSTGCLAKQCQTSLTDSARSGTLAAQQCSLLGPGAVPAGDPCGPGAENAQVKSDEVEDCTSGGADAVCRASEWVSAEMPYCGGVRGGSDAICGGTCSRSGSAVRVDWDTYRSDCSGLVSWAWGLPAPGKTTLGLAPFDTSVSELTTIDALAPGDALNNENHVMLFAGWADKSALKATVIEEYDCGKIARQTEKQFTRASDSELNVSYGGSFHTIRHKK